MNLYRMISHGVLSHRDKQGKITSMYLEEPIVQVPIKEVSFSSEEIVPLVESSVLDTNDPMTIAKYKSNLQVLIQETFQKGSLDQFRLIREDDLFPDQWMWRVNSMQTAREYAKSTLAYSLRMEEARHRVSPGEEKESFSYGFAIPGKIDEEKKEAASLDSQFGQVYEPTKFRSTKHFTINTPLAYTGSYNQVSSGRNFVVIDKPDFFCKSGYGYSADYQDAYLDVTHEPLSISKDAIILIDESKYPELIKDEIIGKQLQERRVVLYRGDEATAINMVLTQEGVLPYRPGAKYIEYDARLDRIMDQSMKDFCVKNQLDYAHNHGNMFGKGGHFSDLFDSEEGSRVKFEEEFISFLQETLPNYTGIINSTFYQFPDKIVRSIDYSQILDAIQKYNDWAHQDEIRCRKEYDLDRSRITPEIHDLFVDTLHKIRDYFASHEKVEESELYRSMLLFFHAPSVEDQLKAAQDVQLLLSDDIKKY